jgi:dipeptidyl-peptidase-4
MPKPAFLFLLATTTALAQAQSQPVKAQLPSKAFVDILKAEFNEGAYNPKYPHGGKWAEGGASYSLFEPSTADPRQNDLVSYETATNKRTILLPAKAFIPAGAKTPLDIDDYTWSADNKLLLLFTNTQKVWRRNTRGDYWLLRVADGKLVQLGKTLPAASLMFAKLSPDSKSVAYVSQNNLYVEDVFPNDAGTNAIHQITKDGSYEIINGTTDWVTEEELDLRDAFRWSPDSQSIAYWQFDQSGVSEYTLINDTKSAYPETFKYKYPHPGGTNASVKVGVIPAKGGATTWVKLPGDPRNNYIPRMEWVEGSSNQLILQYLNRLQNDNQVFLADAATGQAHPLFEDKDPAFVDYVDQFEWVHSGNSGKSTADFLWLSERDGWRHAYLVSSITGKPRLITNFSGDVISEVSVDEKNGYFYFIASPDNPTQAYLYRSRLDGTGSPERITPANEPGTHSYYVAPGGQYALHTYSSATHPPSFDVIELSTHKVLRTEINNDDLIAKENAIDAEPIEFLETAVNAAGENGAVSPDKIKLSTSLVKPPHFDPAKKYPLLVYVYSEPAATLVHDAWDFSMQRAIASEGYLVVSFDNQGTPAPRGRVWRKSIYGQIGLLNPRQQDEALVQFTKDHPYVDATRIGMWGHSGGGSATLNEIFRHPGRLAAGVSIAPEADQALYDSIYQEHYMGLPTGPQGNPKGYHDGSPINVADGLADPLLIIHGSGDDNVHFQATEMLVDKLIALEKPFQFMDYPNRTHSLSEGKGTLEHRFTLMLHFFEEHIPPGPR